MKKIFIKYIPAPAPALALALALAPDLAPAF